jgi:arylsulfatase A-like enzyme
VSNPELRSRVVKTLVATSQVAPTILKALVIEPAQLYAVQIEGTPTLPFVFGEN